MIKVKFLIISGTSISFGYLLIKITYNYGEKKKLKKSISIDHLGGTYILVSRKMTRRSVAISSFDFVYVLLISLPLL